MIVIVSLKIDLEASATLSHMESQIEEAGRAASDPQHSNKPFEPPKNSRKAALRVEVSSATARERSEESC
jgi:hypothetical protein